LLAFGQVYHIVDSIPEVYTRHCPMF